MIPGREVVGILKATLANMSTVVIAYAYCGRRGPVFLIDNPADLQTFLGRLYRLFL